MIDKYRQLATYKRKIKALEDAIKEIHIDYDPLANEIAEELMTRGGKLQSQDEGYALFTIAHRKTWNYPLTIQESQREVDESKKAFQSDHPESYAANPWLKVTLREDIKSLTKSNAPQIH